ncbi:MAG TPA: sulfatase [Polyangia bacterium]|nr:sulfatase [Polyangia bacterium]
MRARFDGGPNRAGPIAWGAALLAATVAAKVALAALRVFDGAAAGWPSPLAVVAILHEDVRLTVGFTLFALALAALARRAPRAARLAGLATVGAYAAQTFWIALNVPVARQLSSPMTYAFLHATGGALSDSIAQYVTPTNIGVPVLLWAGALLLPFALGRRLIPSRRQLAMAAGAAAVWVLAGPAAAARAETRGLDRNAVLTLVETTLARHGAGRGALLPSLASAACAPGADPGTPGVAVADLADLAGAARDRNIVWVIMESAGARAMPLYGGTRDATPNLSALAAAAAVFENAYAAYPESIKGLFSILCSRSPPALFEASEFGAAEVPCRSVAAELGKAGYRTGLFHSGWFAYLGMQAVVDGRGFDELRDAAGIDSRFRSSFGVDDRATARRVLDFVDAQPRGGRFFAVFMPIAGHHPYHAPGDAPRPFKVESDRDEYLNDLHVADDAFGLLRAGLVARGLDQRTLYVVIGDHGEAFREHEGNIAHALHVYEENVRVPFFVAAPGLWTAPRRAPQLASLIDLSPTTLALAGLPIPPEHEGRSLLGGAARVARFFTEQSAARFGLRDGGWKMILDADVGRAQLFDLGADPAERDNLAAAHPDRVRRYRACLGR